MSDPEDRLAEAYGIAAEAQRRADQAEAELKRRQSELDQSRDERFKAAAQDAVDTYAAILARRDERNRDDYGE